jgi:hypothetical protein
MARSYHGYVLPRVPDLTLNKYSSLEGGDVGGALEKHRAFLRQIHRLGLVSGITAKWLYEYDPGRAKGKRLTIMLVFESEEGLPETLDAYVKSSPSSSFYDFKLPKPGGDFPLNYNKVYGYRATLVKREKYAPEDRPEAPPFYSVNEWKMNDEARLINLYNLMRKINKPCAYVVSAMARDYTNLIDAPDFLGNIMRRLRGMLSLRVEKTSSGASASVRDENADYTLERYKSLIEEVAANPHFAANIQAFADDAGYADMLLASAAAEALDEGSHSAVWDEGDFKMEEILSSPVENFFAPQSNQTGGQTAPPAPPKVLQFWPTLFLLKELAPFNALPALYPGESVEIPKETAPSYEKDGLFLGVDNDGYDVYFPLKNLSKHAFLAGVPGSGKTNSMLHIVTELYKNFKIPFLVFEPAKTEYRALLNMPGMEDVSVFSPSAATKFPLHINPFQFPKGIVLAEHIRLLVEVFMGAFPLEPPSPMLLDRAIEAVYKNKNWTPYMRNAGKLEFPTMSELFSKIEEILEKTDYESEVKSNLKSMLEVRIGSLLAREMGDMFDVSESTLAPEDWLRRPAVIELEALGKDQANFTTLLITNLIRETLRANPNAENKPRHVIFFEEAHNLIGPTAEIEKAEDATPKTSATSFIVKMLAEVRALEEAIVIADQLPTKMAPEVIKNTSLKIGHRITAQDDRELLGSTMSADGVQLERMASFTQGEALVIYEGLLKPFELTMNKWARDDKGQDMDEWYVSPGEKDLRKLLMRRDRYAGDMRNSWKIMKEKISASLKRNNEALAKKRGTAVSEERYFDEKSSPLKDIFSDLLRLKAYIDQNIICAEEIRELTRAEYNAVKSRFKEIFTSPYEKEKIASMDKVFGSQLDIFNVNDAD